MDRLLLTLITSLPLADAAIMSLIPSLRPDLIRGLAVVTTTVVFVLTLYLWRIADLASGGYDSRTGKRLATTGALGVEP